MSKVFVGSLSWNTTTPALVDRFSEFGTIEEARILTERETGRSRGYGFITFSTEEAAQAAIAQANETEFDGRVIKVSWPVVRDNSEDPSGGDRQSDNWRNRTSDGSRNYNSGTRGRGRGGYRGGSRGGYNNSYQGNRGDNYRSQGQSYGNNQQGGDSYQSREQDGAYEQ
ncbi:hypothetical protein BB561_005050 [Smittium simulii]|uniref:RRM domain-containing protein n=1 Tax=Smittium simulii TaxID=133385 RepID=A0A2T9YCJ7_9FUNG|nr:hypothetical protein BB561_005050 [Smittium simulii]